MGYYYSKYHFVDHSRKTAALIVVAPVLAHGLYDALLMTSMVNVVLGGICFIITIVLVCKLHIYARKKITSMIDTDNYFGGGVFSLATPSPAKVEEDYEITETGQGNNANEE